MILFENMNLKQDILWIFACYRVFCDDGDEYDDDYVNDAFENVVMT